MLYKALSWCYKLHLNAIYHQLVGLVDPRVLHILLLWKKAGGESRLL